MRTQNFTPANFDGKSTYVPMAVMRQTYQFTVLFLTPLRSRGDTGVISDRILISLYQLGVEMDGLSVCKYAATVTIVVPLDVTIDSVINHVTERVNSVIKALI
jgi:hypothetical protein